MSEKYWPEPEKAPYGVARLGEKYTLLDVFDKFPKKEKNFVNHYGMIFFSGLAGLIIPMGWNIVNNRSLLYQPHITLITTIACAGIAKATSYYKEKADIRTEAICRDYVKLHPERFPPVERKKFKDCLHQWHPSRWMY